MSLINCEINYFLTWSNKCIVVTENYGDQKPKFAITNPKIYVSVVTSSVQDNKKLLQQIKTCFK